MDRPLTFDCLLSDHVVVTNLRFMTSNRRVVQFVDAFVALHKSSPSIFKITSTFLSLFLPPFLSLMRKAVA